MSNNIRISDNKQELDLNYIHDYLTNKLYWAVGIAFDTVKTAIENSLCFGVYTKQGQQIGFARFVTDYAYFAYLCDVFIDENYRNNGIATYFMQYIMQDERIIPLKRIILVTKDAHGLYEKVGFSNLELPERYMEITRPKNYKNN